MAEHMTYKQRVINYHKQNAGAAYNVFTTRKRITPIQRRRLQHKINRYWAVSK